MAGERQLPGRSSSRARRSSSRSGSWASIASSPASSHTPWQLGQLSSDTPLYDRGASVAPQRGHFISALLAARSASSLARCSFSHSASRRAKYSFSFWLGLSGSHMSASLGLCTFERANYTGGETCRSRHRRPISPPPDTWLEGLSKG